MNLRMNWVVVKSDDVIIDLHEMKKHPANMFHLANDA
jgi:hypothetical protein